MSFQAVRRTLFTVHMWVGLILGVLLAALGLSGSLLVYDDKVAGLLDPVPHATTAGQPLPLTMIAGIARDAAAQKGLEGGQLQIMLPEDQGDAIAARIGGISPMGNMPGMNREGAARERRPREAGQGARRRPGGEGAGGGRGGLLVYIDPVSGAVLGTKKAVLPPILTFAHQLHGNFLLGREGRTYVVGWLGVAMCLLGLTGLVLWWPRRGQWKYAFFVRPTAQGLRFHRELHAATGIWIFIVFMVVSFSGVAIAWPQLMGMPNFPRGPVEVQAPEGARMIGASEALAAAQAALPGATPRSITLPARSSQAIAVNLLSHGAINASVLLDPVTGKVLQVRDPSESFMAWQRPLHQGSLGPVWKFLVFLSGLVPTLFVVTGVVMWAKKRKRRVPMTVPADDVTVGEAA